MKSKNLKVVMGICKVLTILSKIAYICCIVGAVCCAFAISALVIINNVSPEAFAQLNDINMDYNTLLADCIIGIIACVAGVISGKLHYFYFKKVKEVGTPFTKEGATSFRTLGIFNICIPVVLAIIWAVLAVIMKADSSQLNFDSLGGLSTGIVMILLSFVLGYGAELEDKKQDDK